MMDIHDEKKEQSISSAPPPSSVFEQDFKGFLGHREQQYPKQPLTLRKYVDELIAFYQFCNERQLPRRAIDLYFCLIQAGREVSRQWLVQESGISDKNIDRYLKHLVDKRLIIKRKQGGQCYYRLSGMQCEEVEQGLTVGRLVNLIPPLKIFIEYMKNGCRATEGTIYSYSHQIVHLYLWKNGFDLLNFTVYPIHSWKKSDLEKYVNFCENDLKYSVNSLRTVISVLKSYFKHCKRVKFIENNLMDEIPVPPRPKKRTRKLDLTQYKLLLTKVENLSEEIILVLLKETGAHPGELMRLNLEDIDWDRKRMAFYNVRARKGRWVPISESVLTLLQRYIEEARGKTVAPKDENALLLNDWGNRLTVRQISNRIRAICKRAGLKGITTHSFRRACAQSLRKRGLSRREIRKWLGMVSRGEI